VVLRRHTLVTGQDSGTDSACYLCGSSSSIVQTSVKDLSDHFQGQLFVFACYPLTVREGFDESWQTCRVLQDLKVPSEYIRNLTL
jgi:hypothetical protein